MCSNKFLCQWLWHSLAKLCTKNYKNPSIFVKVTAKKISGTFFSGHGVDRYRYMRGVWQSLNCLSIHATFWFYLSTKSCGNMTPLLPASNAGGEGVGKNRDSLPLSGFIACCQWCDCQVLYTQLCQIVASWWYSSLICGIFVVHGRWPIVHVRKPQYYAEDSRTEFNCIQ